MKSKSKLKNIKTNKEENQKSEGNEESKQNIETRNLSLTLSKKNMEISLLKKKIKENMQYITSMESEIFTLKKFYSDSSKLKRELD